MKARETGEARGRLGERKPVAIIDIGSNSVRQVVYEGLTRAPSILFNEKVLCGLGKGVAINGRLDSEARDRALRAILRFASLAKQLRVEKTYILATAAVREASDGQKFIKQVEKICGQKAQVLSGKEEAVYAALGVRAGFFEPEGIVGDLGGGSTELIEINGNIENGTTTPLGALRLQQMADDDPVKARKIARKVIADTKISWPGKARNFYAVGGTWRSIAHLYILETGYPLRVVHGMSIEAEKYAKFCQRLVKQPQDFAESMEQINRNRRALVPFGAAVMCEIIDHLEPTQVVTSVTGLREGFLYDQLDDATKQRDALLEASAELSLLRARSPIHSRELIDWTNHAFDVLRLKETTHQRRWRHAACNLADIVWRSNSDHRAEQILGIIHNAGFTSISHEGRAFLSMVSYHRYAGLGSSKVAPQEAHLVSDSSLKLARILAALFRVVYLFSAAQDGLLPHIKLYRNKSGSLVLELPDEVMDMAGEKPSLRIEALGKELAEPVQLMVGA